MDTRPKCSTTGERSKRTYSGAGCLNAGSRRGGSVPTRERSVSRRICSATSCKTRAQKEPRSGGIQPVSPRHGADARRPTRSGLFLAVQGSLLFFGAGSGEQSCHAVIALIARVLENRTGGSEAGNGRAPGLSERLRIIDREFVE